MDDDDLDKLVATIAREAAKPIKRKKRACALKLGGLVRIRPEIARVKILESLRRNEGSVDLAARRLRVSIRSLRVHLVTLEIVEAARQIRRAWRNRFRAS